MEAGKGSNSKQYKLELAPKFLFGIKGDVSNNIHFLDDNMILYPVGHNVVIYRTDDKTQKYIPGIEGSEGITALAVSHNKRQLAVCERATRAVCTVYNLAPFLTPNAGKTGSAVRDPEAQA